MTIRYVTSSITVMILRMGVEAKRLMENIWWYVFYWSHAKQPCEHRAFMPGVISIAIHMHLPYLCEYTYIEYILLFDIKQPRLQCIYACTYWMYIVYSSSDIYYSITWTGGSWLVWLCEMWFDSPYCTDMLAFNTLRPRRNGRHFAGDTFKYIFLNENVIISVEISLKFVPKGQINNISALVQIIAWRRPGAKPLSEPMMVILWTHICVTRPQWVNPFMSDPLLNGLHSTHRHLFT